MHLSVHLHLSVHVHVQVPGPTGRDPEARILPTPGTGVRLQSGGQGPSWPWDSGWWSSWR